MAIPDPNRMFKDTARQNRNVAARFPFNPYKTGTPLKSPLIAIPLTNNPTAILPENKLPVINQTNSFTRVPITNSATINNAIRNEQTRPVSTTNSTALNNTIRRDQGAPSQAAVNAYIVDK